MPSLDIIKAVQAVLQGGPSSTLIEDVLSAVPGSTEELRSILLNANRAESRELVANLKEMFAEVVNPWVSQLSSSAALDLTFSGISEELLQRKLSVFVPAVISFSDVLKGLLNSERSVAFNISLFNALSNIYIELDISKHEKYAKDFEIFALHIAANPYIHGFVGKSYFRASCLLQKYIPNEYMSSFIAYIFPRLYDLEHLVTRKSLLCRVLSRAVRGKSIEKDDLIVALSITTHAIRKIHNNKTSGTNDINARFEGVAFIFRKVFHYDNALAIKQLERCILSGGQSRQRTLNARDKKLFFNLFLNGAVIREIMAWVRKCSNASTATLSGKGALTRSSMPAVKVSISSLDLLSYIVESMLECSTYANAYELVLHVAKSSNNPTKKLYDSVIDCMLHRAHPGKEDNVYSKATLAKRKYLLHKGVKEKPKRKKVVHADYNAIFEFFSSTTPTFNLFVKNRARDQEQSKRAKASSHLGQHIATGAGVGVGAGSGGVGATIRSIKRTVLEGSIASVIESDFGTSAAPGNNAGVGIDGRRGKGAIAGYITTEAEQIGISGLSNNRL